MKVKLLNNATYFGMDHFRRGSVLEGYFCPRSPKQNIVLIKGSDLVECGAASDCFCPDHDYAFILDEECVVVES